MSEQPILETLSPDDCLDLLATVSVGRVGVTIDALPAVLPVNFVLQGGTVVFRTVPGTKLDAATAGMVVAFEADQHGNANRPDGWSVLVRGVAREITEPGALERARALSLHSWAFDGQAHRYIGSQQRSSPAGVSPLSPQPHPRSATPAPSHEWVPHMPAPETGGTLRNGMRPSMMLSARSR